MGWNHQLVNMDPENEPLAEEISFGNHLFRPLGSLGVQFLGSGRSIRKLKGRIFGQWKVCSWNFHPADSGKMFIHFWRIFRWGKKHQVVGELYYLEFVLTTSSKAIQGDVDFLNTPPKFSSSPLKNGGWKTSLSYWVSVTFQWRAVKLREGNSYFHVVFVVRWMNITYW